MTFVGPAQLLGSGIGPMIASFGLSLGDIRATVMSAAALLVTASFFTLFSKRQFGTSGCL
jgi:hypothetical protein